MMLDLNALAVESFETDPGAPELMQLPHTFTKHILYCAVEEGAAAETHERICTTV
jgi:hypothetical protein